MLEPAEVAGLAHALREFGRCACRIVHLLRVARRLLGRDRVHVCAARIGRDLQHRVGGFQLRLLEPAPFDARGKRQRQDAEHVRRERPADAQVIARTRAAEAEAGIRQPPGLHQIGFRQAELRIRCLQPAMIQQRDLHGVVDAERLREQLAGARRDRLAIRVAADDHRVLAEPLARGGGHRVEPAVSRERRAAREPCDRGSTRRDPQGNPSFDHLDGPSWVVWFARLESAGLPGVAARLAGSVTARFRCCQPGPSPSR